MDWSTTCVGKIDSRPLLLAFLFILGGLMPMESSGSFHRRFWISMEVVN